ncbi:MAG: hypothetical protein ACE5GK_00160 [Nitrospiria bacterium]
MTMTTGYSFGDPVIDPLIAVYFQKNEAAQTFARIAGREGWPFKIDHIALRCLNIDRRAAPFLAGGYVFEGETVEYPAQGWWAKIYRKPGLPALFVDQAYEDVRGQRSIIPHWVGIFGDTPLHHAAVLVEEIDRAITILQQAGVAFSGPVIGSPGSRLRQIFSAAEVRAGAAYTVLELTERNGYDGFYADQANRLMQSSGKLKSKK